LRPHDETDILAWHLRQRHVSHLLKLVVERSCTLVAHYAHDLDFLLRSIRVQIVWRGHPDYFPDRIGHLESLRQLGGQLFVDHDNPWRSGAVLLTDTAPGQQRNIECLEVTRIDPLVAHGETAVAARYSHSFSLSHSLQG
jgi:hypothetical protein